MTLSLAASKAPDIDYQALSPLLRDASAARSSC